MPEIRSALGGEAGFPREGEPGPGARLVIGEVADRDLVQLAGWPDSFSSLGPRLQELLACPVPQDTRSATSAGETTVFQIAPERLWVTAPLASHAAARLRAAFTPQEAVVTDLGHSRTLIRIAGPSAAALLARFVPIDLDDGAFPAGRFAQTGMRHVGVLLHRGSADSFDLYLPRSFARWLWACLIESAAGIAPGAPSLPSTAGVRG